MQRVLPTGGAGFIGSHVADLLLESGYAVRALDNLSPQVHPGGRRPDYLNLDVELLTGDVRDPGAVSRALEGVDSVVHLASAVGVGQSMYEVAGYTDVNVRGTAMLLTALMKRRVRRLVVASSMSVYGEGLYRDPGGRPVMDAQRARPLLEAKRWDPVGREGEPLEPVATPEEKTPSLASIYALTKFDHERMGLLLGDAYHIPTVALRFFNTYGSRQALSNPYTGVLAIFAARLLAVESDVSGVTLNIGSGVARPVVDVGRTLGDVIGRPVEPHVTGAWRVGDVRHCYADIRRARRTLGYEPRVAFEDGLEELARWLDGQVADDRAEAARDELASWGLTA